MPSEQEQSATSRTVTKVEAVEVELYECPSCGQDYEEKEMVEIQIDKREIPYGNKTKTRFHGSGQICIYCAETLFGYDRPSSSYNWTHTATGDSEDELSPIQKKIVDLAGLVFIMGLSIAVIVGVMYYGF